VRVAIVDYGVGNLHSIRHAIELAGAEAALASDASEIEESDALILPGVGAFEGAIGQLADKVEAIHEALSRGKPLLGICLGMQLLFERSEEGNLKGLGLVRGEVVRCPAGLKVPHMGWNSIEIRRMHPIVQDICSGSYMYFAHSYYARPEDREAIVATTNYGAEIPSIVASGSVIGVQFHPEKSGETGLRVLRNFVRMVDGVGVDT